METPAFGTWTPCSEALPPVGVPVIVKTRAGQSVAVRDDPRPPFQSWSLPTVIGDYDEEASLLDTHSSQPYGGVTHWMPCPPDPAPTAEEAEEATAEAAFKANLQAMGYEVKTFGAAQSYATEAEAYEAITGRRSAAL